MKKIIIITTLLLGISSYSQTLSQWQKLNARATGYAIIASKNPGIDFSVMMIPWDGTNTLEYNANTQINPSWHPQAVIKGNYFTQPFDDTSFLDYSTVITSQAQFDLYKSTGTQWWIVCSTLDAFSTSETKKINFSNTYSDPSTTPNKISLWSGGANNYFGFGISDSDLDYISQGNHRFYTGFNGNPGSEKMVLTTGGNLGIGTLSPQAKLDVVGKSLFSDNMAVQGKIESKEIKVTTTPTADFVFADDYNLPKLEEVEKHIKEKKHLPEIASAKDMEKDGVNIGEFQIKLLQKIEELTLYTIQQNKQLQEQNEKIIQLQKQLQALNK